jgi:hypothetical protein
LAQQLKTTDGFFQGEYLAYSSQKRAELERLVSESPSAAVGRKLPAVAGSLHDTLCAEAMRALFAARAEGFALLRDAQVFAYWEAVIYEAAFQRDLAPDRFRRGSSVRSFGRCLLAAHLGAEKAADAIMRRLIAESHDSSCSDWAISTGALPFMVRLYEQVTQQQLDIDRRKLPALGGYEALLEPELMGERYRAALDWACKEHIAQSKPSKRGFMPFAAAVIAPLPVELVVWLKMRRRAGLEHETHGHALLESFMATLDPPLAQAPRAEIVSIYERGEPHLLAYLNGE